MDVEVAGVRVLRFTYVGKESIETLPWYKYDLRDFLWRNRKSAVWLKGGHATREAFLAYHPRLAEDVVTLFTKRLEGGGYFDPAPFTWEKLQAKLVSERLVAIGELDIGPLKIIGELIPPASPREERLIKEFKKIDPKLGFRLKGFFTGKDGNPWLIVEREGYEGKWGLSEEAVRNLILYSKTRTCEA